MHAKYSSFLVSSYEKKTDDLQLNNGKSSGNIYRKCYHTHRVKNMLRGPHWNYISTTIKCNNESREREREKT